MFKEQIAEARICLHFIQIGPSAAFAEEVSIHQRGLPKVRFRPLINAKPGGQPFMWCAFERGSEVFSRGGGLPEKLRCAVLPWQRQVAQSDEPLLLLKPNAQHLDKHFDAPAVLA